MEETVLKKTSTNVNCVFKKPLHFEGCFLIKQGAARNWLPEFFLGALEIHYFLFLFPHIISET